MTDVPPEAAAARLTALLRGAGVFGRGEVADLAVETSRDTLVSRITRLRLTYDVAVTPGPSHIFVKSQRDGIDSSCRDPAAASWPFTVSSAPTPRRDCCRVATRPSPSPLGPGV